MTWRRWRPGPCRAATTGWSAARRSGRAWPSTRPAASCSPAPRPGTAGSPRSSPTWTPPGITVRPLRTMHGVDEFAEVFFDDVVIPGDGCSAAPGTAGGWRRICSPTNAPPASGTGSPTCTRGWTGSWLRRRPWFRRRRRPRAGLGVGVGFGGCRGYRVRLPGAAHRPLPLAGHPAAAGGGERARAGDVGRQGAARHGRAAAVRHRTGPAAGSDRAHRIAVADPSTCSRGPRRSTAAPPRSSATSSPGGCSAWGRTDRGRRRTRPAGRHPAQDDDGGVRPGPRPRAGPARLARTCSPSCPPWRSRWSSGCSARPGRTRRCSTTCCCTRPGTGPGARCRCRTRAARGWCGSAATVGSQALDSDLPLRPCQALAAVDPVDPVRAGGRAAGARVVAGRRRPGHARRWPGRTRWTGSSSAVRSPRSRPSGTGWPRRCRARRRRGGLAGRCGSGGRGRLDAGQGGGWEGGGGLAALTAPALPAGARRDRVHRRARPAPARPARARPGRPARQRTGADL